MEPFQNKVARNWVLISSVDIFRRSQTILVSGLRRDCWSTTLFEYSHTQLYSKHHQPNPQPQLAILTFMTGTIGVWRDLIEKKKLVPIMDPYDIHIIPLNIFETQFILIGIHNLSKWFLPILATVYSAKKRLPKDTFKHFNDFRQKLNNMSTEFSFRIKLW